MKTVLTIRKLSCLIFGIVLSFQQIIAQVNFSTSKLSGTSMNSPTSLQFGPDGKLYVASQGGSIYRYTVQKNGSNNYAVTQTEIINLVKQIKNHNDDGNLNTTVTSRQITGIFVSGTAAVPKLYVSSSDPRIGGAAGNSGALGDGDANLDTNSGILSLLTWNGSTWDKTDLVRGLPRSEENHAVNGIAVDASTNILYLNVGGHTNAGSPSVNFAKITEYALSACILKIDLNQINSMPVKGTGNEKYIYDLPTLDDPTRTNAGSFDVNDPFGGNDGRNQAKLIAGGPVQVFSAGFRNAYDLVITKTAGKQGRFYTVDNGANQGWGGHPDKEGTAQVTNKYITGEPGSFGSGPNDAQVNNLDNLQLVFKPGMSAPIYGGHPNPIRANPGGAGLFWKDASGEQFQLNPTPDWPPVPLGMADPIQADFRNPGANNGALATFNSSTNGITEYTATGFFGGAMTGNLLVASLDGSIRRIQLNTDGSQVTSNTVLATGFGKMPLDVVAQGDNDPFPGSFWVADYQTGSIHVFEAVGGSTVTPTPNSSTWQIENNSNAVVPDKRQENAFVEVSGKFYLLGGRGIKAVNVYNPVNKSWSTAAPIPNGKELHHFQAVNFNNKIYVINAFTGYYPVETAVPDIYIYDPANNSWTIKPNIVPTARRRGSCATVVYNNKIYLSGGIINGHNSGTVNWTDVYDPANDSWNTLANAPHLRDHIHGAVINGKMYIASGRRTSASTGNVFGDMEPTVDVYTFATNSWSTLPSSANLPTTRAGASCVAFNNNLYVIGGESLQSNAHNETASLDPNTNTWTKQAAMTTGRQGTQALVYNAKIYIAAGSFKQGGSDATQLSSMESLGSGTSTGTTCTGNNTSTTLDDDGDGYSNKDEADNGTDPCSSASKPNDNDNDKLSNLNDPDDDNDGILDVNDVFHIDASNGKNTTIPLNYPFLNGNPGTGLFGMGFTGLMSNGIDPDKLYDQTINGFIMGGAVGLATVPGGSGSASANTQKQAFQFGLMEDVNTAPFTVESALVSPFFNNVAVANLKDEQQGMYIGNGDQDNYIFVGITPNNGNPSIIVITEDGGVNTTSIYPVSGLFNGNLTVYLDVNPAAGTVQPKYKKTGDLTSTAVGPTLTVTGKLSVTLKGTQAVALGILASSKSGNSFASTWDYMSVYYNKPPTVVTSGTRINAGGPAVVVNGVSWIADNFYNSLEPINFPNTYSTTNTIANTTYPAIYQTERTSKSFFYNIPVTNGNYTVNLHFAEIYWTTPGSRIMNIDVENGQGMMTNFDLFAKVGSNNAYIQSFPITVADGFLTINLAAVTDQAKISGIEILTGSVTPPPPPPPTNTQQVVSYTLINAATDVDIRTLKNGDTLNFNTLPTKLLNIRANTNPAKVGSVIMNLTGTQNVNRTESGAPYALAGDINGNYSNWTPLVGAYTLTATPYSASGGGGSAGLPLTIKFIVGNFTIPGTSMASSLAGSMVVDQLNSSTIDALINPNPTIKSFRLQYRGQESATISVYTSGGILLETFQNINPNQVIDFGANWKIGLYYALIKTSKNAVVKKMVKQ
jgi:N-acetylneuraminic acid mutarotase